jgi:hypothetical protein
MAGMLHYCNYSSLPLAVCFLLHENSCGLHYVKTRKDDVIKLTTRRDYTYQTSHHGHWSITSNLLVGPAIGKSAIDRFSRLEPEIFKLS